jgi:urate oxidase
MPASETGSNQNKSGQGQPHPHAFFGAGGEKRVARIQMTRQSCEVQSGISGLKLVKTTDSAFAGFVRDRYTTLVDTNDRIFGTSAEVTWLYTRENPDYNKVYVAVRSAVLDVFAEHASLGVQHTINEIAQTALARAADMSQITITMPNEHRIPFNLEPFGLENKNEIFVTTAEPFGLISATVKRA